MKTRISKLAGLIAVFIFLTAISATAQGRKGNGNVIKQDRAVTSFSGIDVGGAFDVILIQGDQEGVVIETDENLQELIEVKSDNGMLEFSSKPIRNPSKLKAYVTFVKLNKIIASGASTVKSTALLEADNLLIKSSGASELKLNVGVRELIVNISGAGELSVDGTADILSAEISGAGNLNATRLLSRIGNVEASGAGSARVNVSDNVNFETSGAGSIKNFYGKTDVSETTRDGGVIDVKTKGDSTTVKVGGLEVKVVDGDSTRVTIGNSDLVVYDDGEVHWKKRHRTKFNGHWAGFEMGINGYLTSDNSLSLPSDINFLELRYEKSAEVAINFLEQNFNLINNKLGLVTGLGYRSNNYRFEPNVMLLADTTPIGGMFLEPKADYLKSKLVVNYLTVPLLLEFQTNPYSRSSSFHITAGAIMGFRFSSHSKIVKDENGKEKIKNKDPFNMAPFRWDLTARAGWGVINLYANYSLNSLFLADKGPELYPFSVGITFTGW